MKNFLLAILIMLTSTLMIAIIPTEAEAAIYEDTVRLHILAASDSAEDQGMKLKLRDTLLERYSDELSGCEDIFSAKSHIYQLLPEINDTCNQILRDNGYGYIAKADRLPFVTCLKRKRKVYGVITDIITESFPTKYEFETWFDQSK